MQDTDFGEGTASIVRASVDRRPAGPISWLKLRLGYDVESKTLPPGTLPNTAGDPAAVAVLTYLLDHSDPHVRMMAIWGLGRSGAKAQPALPKLLSLAGDSTWRRGQIAVSLNDMAREAIDRIDADSGLPHPPES
jgi:HEAT repeats